MRWGGVGLICTAICAEILLASPAVWPLPRSSADIPRVYEELEDGAVLDLPITVPNLERGVYTYYQTVHRQPSPYGLNEPVPARLRQNRLTDFLLYLEAGRAITLPRQMPELELVLGQNSSGSQGYRYIVMHESLYSEPKARMIQTVLDGLLVLPESIWTTPWPCTSCDVPLISWTETRKRALGEALVALLVSFLAASTITWPAVLHMDEVIIGGGELGAGSGDIGGTPWSWRRSRRRKSDPLRPGTPFSLWALPGDRQHS